MKHFFMSMLLISFFASSAHADAYRCEVASVTDGDTFKCATGEIIRPANFDAPEYKGRADCLAEKLLAELATEQAILWLDDKVVRIIPLKKKNGEKQLDKYGRTLALVILADGRDLGRAMVGAGIARTLHNNQWSKAEWCGKGDN